jgi:colanic acid biosynthesis glycosyl transferase WcaI
VFPKDKIVQIPNWVDVNFIRPLPKENNKFRATHQLSDKFVVLYSGNIALTQGLETVISAAVRLLHIPDIAIVIVGEEKLWSDCSNRDTCKATNVTLLPFQPRAKLPEMLAAADIGLVVQKQQRDFLQYAFQNSSAAGKWSCDRGICSCHWYCC